MVLLSAGKTRILSEISSDLYKCGLGTNGATPTESQTGLLGSYTSLATCDAVAGWNNVEDADPEVLNSNSTDYIEGNGCLNLPLTPGGTYDRGGWWKDLGGSYDLSDKRVYVGYFITDKSELTTGGSCVRVYFGTNSLQHASYWNFPKTDLYNGWQYLECDVSSPDGTFFSGGTMTNIHYIKLEVHSSNSIGGSDMRMDDWHYLTSDTAGITNSLEDPSVTTYNQVLELDTTFDSLSGTFYELREIGNSMSSGGSVQLNRQNFSVRRKPQTEEWRSINYLYIK